MHTDFVSPSDSRWNEALRALRHDIYDLPEYVAVCGRYEEATPVAFYAREGAQFALIPLLQRPLPSSFGAPLSWSDATSPYGYSSALFTGGPEWSFRVVNAFVAACAELQIISVFVRLHPLLPAPEAAMNRIGVRRTHGETVRVDLTRPLEELRAEMRRNHKVGICQLRGAGFSVSVDDWPLYQRFIEIYRETMERVGADPFYHFPASYFQQLKEALGPHLHLLSVVAPDGETAAAGLLTEVEGIVQFHLAGSAGEYLKLAPSKLMFESAIAWAKAAGNRVLHLGGGVGARPDSLFQFKAGFSGLRSRFQTWRIVCDDSRYSELVRAVHPSGQAGEDYFPAYREADKRFYDEQLSFEAGVTKLEAFSPGSAE